MSIKQLSLAGITIFALLVFTSSYAEEITKQTAASRQASKARSHAIQEGEGSPDTTAGTSNSGTGQKEGDNMPLLDASTMDKAARDSNDALKKMDKVLDGF